jgi:hypothetical protein
MVGVQWQPWWLLVGAGVEWQVSELRGAQWVAGRSQHTQRCCVCLAQASQESFTWNGWMAVLKVAPVACTQECGNKSTCHGRLKLVCSGLSNVFVNAAC